MGKITISGKALILALIMMMSLVTITSALNEISSVPYSGHLDAAMVGRNSDVTQFFYQKFKTSNVSLGVNKIQLFMPSNTTGSYTIGEKALRIGIAKSSGGTLTYTPLQWYNLMSSWLGGFRCHGYFNYKNRGSWVNVTLSTGNYYLEPNQEYYIAWFPIGDFLAGSSWAAYVPRGSTPAVFNEWSIHRGNRTSSSWLEPRSNYNLSHILWGYNMNVEIPISSHTNSTINALAWPNEGYNHGRTWNFGLWIGNTTTDVNSFWQNVTTGTNWGGGVVSPYQFTGLWQGQFYHVRPWISKNASYPFVLGTELHFLTNPGPPTTVIEEPRADNGTTIIRWTKGNCTEAGLRTVIYDKVSGPVLDPKNPGTGATVVYNGTSNVAAIPLGSKTTYLTLFSFIDAEEDGVNLTSWSLTGPYNLSEAGTLRYNIRIENETWPFGLATIGEARNSTIEFTSKDGTVNYMGNYSVNTFSVICDASDVITYRYKYNGTIFFERSIFLPSSELPEDRNITIYIPNVLPGINKGQTKPITIRYSDKTSGKFSISNYAVGYIEANGTRTAHSDYIQADNALRTYLIIGNQYALYASSDLLAKTRLGSIIVFDDIYFVDVTTTDVQNVSWTDYVKITSGWEGTKVYLRLINADAGLFETTVRLFNATGTLKETKNYTGTSAYNFNYSYDTGDVNKTLFYANVYMRYQKGSVQWTASTYVYWSADTSGIEVDMDTLDRLMTEALGTSPVYIPGSTEIIVPYSVLILTGILILFFFILRPEHSAFVLILMGFIMALTRIFGIVKEATLSNTDVATVILIGVLLWIVITKFGKKEIPAEEPQEIIIRRK